MGLKSHERRAQSQNGEDGVVDAILARIRSPAEFFVEFGVGDGSECNCAALAARGWPGLFGEAEPDVGRALAARWSDRADVVTRTATFTPENVERLLSEAGVPEEPAVLSIDVDGTDWYIWRAVERRPALVVIEYNGSLPLDGALVQPLDAGRWDGTDYFGASLGALEMLGADKGYRLVHTESAGVNAFFVREDLLPGSGLPEGEAVVRTAANYFGSGCGHPRDPHDRPWVDLRTGALTGRAEAR